MKNRREDNGCCNRTYLKSIMIVFNIFFWVSGAFFLLTGLATYFLRHDYISLLSVKLFSITTYMMIAIGGTVIILAFIGCLGTMKENRGCLIFYSVMLIVVFMAETCAGLIAYMYESAIHEELARNLNQTMMSQYSVDPAVTQAVDAMQSDFECCGAEDYTDWFASTWSDTRIGQAQSTVPGSCCITPNTTCAQSFKLDLINKEGCIYKLERFFRLHLILIGGISLGLSILQIFGHIFSCCLACKVKEIRL